MCPPPCGRRRSNCYQISSEKITKSEVDGIIINGNFQKCLFRSPSEPAEIEYEGCLHNLQTILHDGKTKVKVVGSRSKDFRYGYRTIVMTAPCLPATFVIRTK